MNRTDVFQATIAPLDHIDEFLPSADELDDRSEDFLNTSSVLDRMLNDSDDGSRPTELAPTMSVGFSSTAAAPGLGSLPFGPFFGGRIDSPEPSPIMPASNPMDVSSASTRPVVVEAGTQDSDLISFNAALDASIASFKQSAVRDFDQAKIRLQAMQKAQRDADTLQWQSIVNDKNSLIESLTSRNDNLQNELTSANLRTANSLKIGAQTRYRLQQKADAKLSFEKWRRTTDWTRNMQMKTNMAFRLRKERLLHSVVSCWERKVKEAREQKHLERVQSANQLDRQKMISMTQLEKENLQNEINNLRTALAKEQEAKNNLQDNLKRVFMRGVSALNFEAMSLLAGEEASKSALPEVDEQIAQLTTKFETTPVTQASMPTPVQPIHVDREEKPVVKEDTATTVASKPEFELEAPRTAPAPEPPVHKDLKRQLDARQPLSAVHNKTSLPFVFYSKDSRWQSAESTATKENTRIRVVAKP